MKIVFVSLQHLDIAVELQKAGHEVVAPLMTGDLTLDLEILREMVDSTTGLVIGAASGGSLVMKLNPTQPIMLLAPAYKKDRVSLKKFALVVHGALDDIIPVEDSLELPNVRIYMVQDNHWFRDQGIKKIISLVNDFEKV